MVSMREMVASLPSSFPLPPLSPILFCLFFNNRKVHIPSLIPSFIPSSLQSHGNFPPECTGPSHGFGAYNTVAG